MIKITFRLHLLMISTYFWIKCTNGDELMNDSNEIKCDLSNEEFLTCGSECAKSCCNYNLNFTCSTKCIEGCFCKKGYVRDIFDNCVPVQECGSYARKPKCNMNEQIPSVGVQCERTCFDDLKYVYPSDDHCPCALGYVRDARGQCVLPMFCPQACFGYNEVFECRLADTKCSNLRRKPKETECTFGCYCENNFARSYYGNCVPIEHCFIHNNPVLPHFIRQQKLL